MLCEFEEQGGPLDFWMHCYFRKNKALGSKDRAFIAETAYALMRWRALLDHFCGKYPSWQERYEVYRDKENFTDHPSLPDAIRYSIPSFLFELLVHDYGLERARELALENNFPAPVTLRCNLLRSSLEELMKNISQHAPVRPCKQAPQGCTLQRRMNFFSLPFFKEGAFEAQDEGSQLVADQVQALPGQHVLDYCSGSGGKTLAIAPSLQQRGQLYLHDIRPSVLLQARKRLKRAGIQNAQIHEAGSPSLKKLKKKMDWVLADVPCSGTGTLRRNPDMKWRLTEEQIERLVGQQRAIFEQALSYLKPEGQIVYATCSVLKRENQEQVEHFCRNYSLEVVGSPFQSFPTRNGMDGFFAVTLRRAEQSVQQS